jgi:hypothetical protein
MSSDRTPDAKTGYGVPPKNRQFPKGRSGNPKGRPKVPRDFSKVVADTLNEPVVVNENGQRKKITKEEAMVKQLVNKAAGGDARATQQMLGIRRAIEDSTEVLAPTSVTDEADRQVLKQIIARIRRNDGGGTNE